MTESGEATVRHTKALSSTVWKWVRRAVLASVAAQVSGVVAVYAIDRVRVHRSPGGFHGFPSTTVDDTIVDGNEIRIYTEGTGLYADQINAIDQARETVYFETYVWRSDRVGRLFKEALYRAAERGVRVYVIFDGFGSLNSSPVFKHFKPHPNLFVRRISEVRTVALAGGIRSTGRDHRKLLLVDQNIGFVGGFNVGVDFGTEWRDTHIRIIGPAVKPLCLAFCQFWNIIRTKGQPTLQDWDELPWTGNITPAFNLPSSLLFPIRGQYLEAFEKSRESLDVATAYFVPDRDILHALIRAAQRGVKVRILIPEYSNHILADWVARPFFGQMLEAGIEIWLYQHAMIHAKTVVADGHRSIVGTANIDRLSMAGNYEVTVQIDSQAFGRQMQNVFDRDLTTSRRLTLEEWKNRGRATQFLEMLVSRFSFIV